MIYAWLYPLHRYAALSSLNVLRYVPFRVLCATMTALLISFACYPAVIELLRRMQIGQVVRESGPEAHLSKSGTPTMGGVMILATTLLATVLWADPHNSMVWLVQAVTLAYGAIGFVDDRQKVLKRNSEGLSARAKIILQTSVALLACLYLWGPEKYQAMLGLPSDWLLVRNRLALPFVSFDKVQIELLPWAYVGFAVFVLVGTSNAVNLTDGLDGLAIGPVMINAGVYMIMAYVAGASIFGHHVAHYLHIPTILSAGELAVFCGAIIGSGIGFLWYNTYPAQVFMGDVGALALGGALGSLAICTKNEVLSVLLGGVFVVESLSVIGQVLSFRYRKKRILLMAPIHHHFEKKGWAEPKVIVRFWIISVMLGIAALATLKLR